MLALLQWLETVKRSPVRCLEHGFQILTLTHHFLKSQSYVLQVEILLPNKVLVTTKLKSNVMYFVRLK